MMIFRAALLVISDWIEDRWYGTLAHRTLDRLKKRVHAKMDGDEAEER